MTFETFVAEYQDGLSRYAMVLIGDREQAKDLAAETMLRTYLRWDRIATMDHPVAYVRKILLSIYLNGTRKFGRTRSNWSAPVSEQQPAPADNPDDRLDLATRLRTLPRRQQAALVLKYYGGYQEADIAQALDTSESAVRSLVFRGLTTLRVDGAKLDPDPRDPARMPRPSLPAPAKDPR